MTTEHEASRTLVKSPPELWAECSAPDSLARHLGEFGEITITRLEPESAVAWEGEHASGTVRIEPSGWGTRVTLTAETRAEEPEVPSEAEAVEEVQASDAETQPAEEEDHAPVEETVEEPESLSDAETTRARARWRRLTARFRRRKRGSPGVEEDPAETPLEPCDSTAPPRPEADQEPEPVPEPELEAEPATEPQPELAEPAASDLDAAAVLASALDSLGQAHHRPFSRA